MANTDRGLVLGLSDRFRFAVDDIREKFMSDKSTSEIQNLLSKHADGKTAQAYIRSSINHLAAISEMLETQSDNVTMSPEDMASLIAIENAINTLNEKLHK